MKIGAQHEVLNVLSFLDFRVEINVNEDQEKDDRKVVFCCFEMCFGHRASMRSPIKSRAGRKKEESKEHAFLNGCSFRGAGITAT